MHQFCHLTGILSRNTAKQFRVQFFLWGLNRLRSPHKGDMGGSGTAGGNITLFG